MGLFARFVQLLPDKTATTLKHTALMACPVRAILLNVPARTRKWLIRNAYTVVRSLAVRSSSKYLEVE